jgi:hypothetical protein
MSVTDVTGDVQANLSTEGATEKERAPSIRGETTGTTQNHISTTGEVTSAFHLG